MNLDILREVTERLPNESLKTLSHTSLWNEVKKFSEDQLWWYHRTEFLVGRELKPQKGDWRRAYKSLSENGLGFDTQQDYGSLLVVSILFEIGADPTDYSSRIILEVVYDTSEEEALESLKLLLSDPRIDPSVEDNLALKRACHQGSFEITKLLLSDPRVDPSSGDNEPILQASWRGHTDIVELLLADPRVDPSDQDNMPLREAVASERTEVIRLLLNDKRVDPSANHNQAIQDACDGGDPEIVSMLLADRRVNPSQKNMKRAVKLGYTEVVHLLLTDPRVDVSEENYFLYDAVVGNHLEVVRLLLTLVDVDASDGGYQNTIKTASKVSSLEIIQLLLAEKDVDPTTDDNYPLRMARKHKRYDVEKLLLTNPEVLRLDEENKRRR